MADLRVDIAAEFVGRKAFKEADIAAVRLDKTIKKLARTFGVTLGAGAIAAYGKAAVKAFAEDEAAANRLATAVDNLGLSFSKVQVATFISDLESTASIADDVLRPAFQSLLNITGSLTKSQELLNNAIQISRASGVDLATVTNDLGKGYVGITRGLIKYNTGLTRAELQTKSFNEILGIMLAKSAGAAQDYLTTTSFKMDTLALASQNAKETIGKGLVDAFARIGGGTEAKDAAKAINNIAKAVNGVTLVLGTAIGFINKFRQGYTNFLMDPFGTGMPSGGASINRSASPAGTAVRLRQQREAEAAAARRAKEVAALTKKQVAATKALTAEQKKQNSLKKSATVFDMEQIQAIAALKGQLSAEDRKRVEAQLALTNENDALAQKLTREILMAQDATGGLYRYFLTIGDAKIKNPFAFLDEWLMQFQDKLKKTFEAGAPSVYKPPAGAFMEAPANVSADKALEIADNNLKFALDLAAANDKLMADIANSNAVKASNDLINQIFPVTVSQPTGNFTYGQGNPMATNVYVTVQGSVTTEEDLVRKIASGLQNQSLSTGDSAYINRRTGGFAG